MISKAEFEAANRAGRERRERQPFARAVTYDADRQRVVITLSTGAEFSFPAELAEGLRDADPKDLSAIVISPSGFAISFPRLDADFDLTALMEGVFGSRRRYTLKELIAQCDSNAPIPDERDQPMNESENPQPDFWMHVIEAYQAGQMVDRFDWHSEDLPSLARFSQLRLEQARSAAKLVRYVRERSEALIEAFGQEQNDVIPPIDRVLTALIKEHDMVEMVRDFPEQGLKAGDIGAVVAVYGDGEGFTVEFPAKGQDEPKIVTIAPVMLKLTEKRA